MSNAAIEDQIDAFFAQMSNLREKTKQDARDTGVAFSVFDYLRVDEYGLSTILRDLIDPEGLHGQGTVFLDAFLHEATGRVWENLEAWTVVQEQAVQEGQIDLLVSDHAGRARLVIENKPFALEQETQLTRYAKYALDEGNCYLIYLNGTGTAPQTLDDESRKRLGDYFVQMNYRQSEDGLPNLERWLNVCREMAKADKIKWFLHELATYIENNFVQYNRKTLNTVEVEQ